MVSRAWFEVLKSRFDFLEGFPVVRFDNRGFTCCWFQDSKGFLRSCVGQQKGFGLEGFTNWFRCKDSLGLGLLRFKRCRGFACHLRYKEDDRKWIDT